LVGGIVERLWLRSFQRRYRAEEWFKADEEDRCASVRQRELRARASRKLAKPGAKAAQALEALFGARADPSGKPSDLAPMRVGGTERFLELTQIADRKHSSAGGIAPEDAAAIGGP
jgi:hypothetical protein